MGISSRSNALTWPYPRHRAFEALLRKSNADWFAERGYAVNERMPYLLSGWDQWPQNIIVPELVDHINTEKYERALRREGFPLHKYIHHGLSSQAMVINLVGPLIISGDLHPLQKAFEEAGIHWPQGMVSAKFEVEDRKVFNEDTGQPTSIDLMIQGQDARQTLYIESKLVEHEFGGCSVFTAGDCDGASPARNFSHCYLHHLGRQYWPLMEKYGFLEGLAGTSPICPFALYYQFFRELLFAVESGGDFVLLFDQRNPTFFCGDGPEQRGLMPFLTTFVPEGLKQRIHFISVQQVITAYKRSGEVNWVEKFEKKYGIHD